jgi:glycine oxidase
VCWRDGIQWWNNVLPEDVVRHGTLVLAPRRAHFELDRFAARTKGHSMLSADEIATLEPDLAGRFQRGLFFISEAHFDPRQALERLMIRLKQGGVSFIVSTEQEVLYDFVIDATGSSRLPLDRNLRGVRGEMLLIRTKDVHLSRPVRLLHPRIPLYVVPRKENIFMIGATMIESHNNRLMSVRSMMEFLNAAYALHPAFSEAEIIETGVGIRPAYANNFPRIERKQKFFFVNGFYRHGYLLAPEMARRIAHLVLHAESENEEL